MLLVTCCLVYADMLLNFQLATTCLKHTHTLLSQFLLRGHIKLATVIPNCTKTRIYLQSQERKITHSYIGGTLLLILLSYLSSNTRYDFDIELTN